MQRESNFPEVKDARSKKSREKSFGFKQVLFNYWLSKRDHFRSYFGFSQGKMVWENNDFPQYFEVFRISREKSVWDGQDIRQETYAQDWLSVFMKIWSLFKVTVMRQFATWRLKGMDAKEVKENSLNGWRSWKWKESWNRDKIRVCQRKSTERFSSLLLWFIDKTWLSWMSLSVDWTQSIQNCSNKSFSGKERGATIIFSDHVPKLASRNFCDDILIWDGRVVLHGPVQDVRNQYGENASALFREDEARKNWKKTFLMSSRSETWPNKGSWKWFFWRMRALEGNSFNFSSGQYIATFD